MWTGESQYVCSSLSCKLLLLRNEHDCTSSCHVSHNILEDLINALRKFNPFIMRPDESWSAQSQHSIEFSKLLFFRGAS